MAVENDQKGNYEASTMSDLAGLIWTRYEEKAHEKQSLRLAMIKEICTEIFFRNQAINQDPVSVVSGILNRKDRTQ